MKRRKWLKDILTGAIVAGVTPLSTLRAATNIKPNHSTIAYPSNFPVKVAHIELATEPSNIADLYIAHAEASRIIHDYVADSLSGVNIPVSRLNVSGVNPSPEELKQIEDLDVYSVSQGMSQYAAGIVHRAELYEEYWRKGDAIGVYSAGNQGKTKIAVPKQSMSDFSDTAVIVGEAGKNSDGVWQVKDHSQKVGNVTFLAPNITDQGFAVPIINQSPNLIGHGELVRNAEIWMDVHAKLEVEGHDKELYQDVFIQKRIELLADPDYVVGLDNRVQGYLNDDPTPFHQKMIYRLSATDYAMDENGLSTHVNGTSFCSPYVAGVFSAAKFESKMREAQGKPSLSSEELVALSYLSCDSVINQEGGEDLENKENGRGIVNNGRTGFGVFTAENFSVQQKEAYQILDRNPELSSIPRRVRTSEFVPEKDGSGGFIMNIPEDEDITILKARFEYSSENIPHYVIKLTSPQGHEQYLDMSQGMNDPRERDDYYYSWGVTEQVFGEVSAGEWKVEPIFDISEGGENRWQINPSDIKLTIYGVEKGGLIDQMIDKKLSVEKPIEQEKKSHVPPVKNNRGGGRGF